MLKSIDILIGLSLVMLFVSMAVTLLTQAMLAIRQTRGRHLLEGLADLLSHLDPGLAGNHADEIAKLIIANPLVNGGKVGKWIRYGDVIHRYEFTKMLLDLAVGQQQAHAKTTSQQAALAELRRALEANGISDPSRTLDKVRMVALRLEQSNPELANDVRQDIALLREASSQFLAKINLRFDQVIDRVSERFTFSARLWSLIGSTLIAVVLQLDTVTLVNRLAMDDAMRSAFVQEAMAGVPRPPAPSLDVLSPASQVPLEKSAHEDQDQGAKTHRYYLAFLAKQGVIAPPETLNQWWNNWQNVNIPGLFLTILLLSLGAPFWYGALSKLLQLRSALAAKDDVQRLIRQTQQPAESVPEVGSGPVKEPPQAAGERGDLNQIG